MDWEGRLEELTESQEGSSRVEEVWDQMKTNCKVAATADRGNYS